jgi:hypothetical protein
MQAHYKYNIGTTFFVPRVKEDHERLTTVVDGLEYEHIKTSYHPHVKQKKIVDVQIQITERDTAVTYYVENVEKNEYEYDMGTYVDEEDLNCFSEYEAFRIAEEYAANEKTCYDY